MTGAEVGAPEGKPFTWRPVAGCDPTHCPVGAKVSGDTGSSHGISKLPYGFLLAWPIQTYLSLSNYSGPAANVQFLTLQRK